MVSIRGWDAAARLLVAHLVTAKLRPTAAGNAIVSAASVRATAMVKVGVKRSRACGMGVARRWIALIGAAAWVRTSAAMRGGVRLSMVAIAHWSYMVLWTSAVEANANGGPHHLRPRASSTFARVVCASAPTMAKVSRLRGTRPLLRGRAAGL